MSVFVLLLLVSSPFVLAQGNETDTCTGFLNSIKCFIFGDSSKRPVAGAAWYDRGISLPWYNPEGGALVGKVGQNPLNDPLENLPRCSGSLTVEGLCEQDDRVYFVHSSGDDRTYQGVQSYQNGVFQLNHNTLNEDQLDDNDYIATIGGVAIDTLRENRINFLETSSRQGELRLLEPESDVQYMVMGEQLVAAWQDYNQGGVMIYYTWEDDEWSLASADEQPIIEYYQRAQENQWGGSGNIKYTRDSQGNVYFRTGSGLSITYEVASIDSPSFSFVEPANLPEEITSVQPSASTPAPAAAADTIPTTTPMTSEVDYSSQTITSVIAACNEYPRACLELGNRYANTGLDVRIINFRQAVGYYAQACNGGNAEGCNNLAYRYEHGEGVAVNNLEALRFYTQACLYDYDSACGSAGTLLGNHPELADQILSSFSDNEQMIISAIQDESGVAEAQEAAATEREVAAAEQQRQAAEQAEIQALRNQIQAELGYASQSTDAVALQQELTTQTNYRSAIQQMIGDENYNDIQDSLGPITFADGIYTAVLAGTEGAEATMAWQKHTDGIISQTTELAQPSPTEADHAATTAITQTEYMAQGGQTILTQSNAQREAGTYSVPGIEGQEVIIREEDVAAALASDNGAAFYDPEEPEDVLGWATVSDGTITTVNADADTQRVITPNGDEYNLEGTADEDDQTFTGISGGTWARSNGDRYTLDYDSNARGLDEPVTEDIEIFDQRGWFTGVSYPGENGLPERTDIVTETGVTLIIGEQEIGTYRKQGEGENRHLVRTDGSGRTYAQDLAAGRAEGLSADAIAAIERGESLDAAIGRPPVEYHSNHNDMSFIYDRTETINGIRYYVYSRHSTDSDVDPMYNYINPVTGELTYRLSSSEQEPRPVRDQDQAIIPEYLAAGGQAIIDLTQYRAGTLNWETVTNEQMTSIAQAMGYDSLADYAMDRGILIEPLTFAVTPDLYKDAIVQALQEDLTEMQAAEAEQQSLEPTADEEAAEQLALENIDEVESATGSQEALQSVYAVLQSTKSYPALNNLLWGNADWYKSWQKDMDQAFAPLLAENWFPSWVCEGDKKDIEPEGVVTLTTPGGIDQMVASIQAERSPDATPMLCQYKQDEDLWFCEEGQVCGEDGFCYLDQNADQEPDTDIPLEGYFYKITWGAGAPQDVALTPFIDENGVAVSFNVFVYDQNNNAIPIYRRGGDTRGPIELSNGGSDQDVFLKYSTSIYTKACLVWDKAPLTFYAETEHVKNPCFNIQESTQGQVSWQNSGQPESQGVTTGAGDVPLTRNTNW